MAVSDALTMKEAQRKHWDAVAGGWALWRRWTERNFLPLTNWFRGAAGWRPGVRALDVACGPGYPALEAARLVRPGGSVLAGDLAQAMVEAATAAAAADALDNMTCRVMDAERLEVADEMFDAVTNAYGLMFCPEPERAMDEAFRVLAHGGRAAFATWDQPSNSPFFTVITGVAAPLLGLQAPEPGAPGPFRFSSPAMLGPLLRGAGFDDVRVDLLEMRFQFDSVDEYCQVFSDVAWKAKVEALAPQDRERFRGGVAEAVRALGHEGPFALVSSTLCASGRRP